MKIKISMLLALCLGSIAFGAGSLTPPGAPAPTMKTLDEIDQSVSNVITTLKTAEPRTPLIDGSPGVAIFSSGTIRITQSGSYYLTTNLTVSSSSGIQILASGVTLDLNGFTLRSTSSTTSSSGIWIQGSNVSIFNGHIVSGTVYDSGVSGDQYTGSGFENGIYAQSSDYTSIRIHDISVSGCDLRGIYIESWDSLVESCTVKTVGTRGVKAGIVNNCSATICGEVAISGYQITGCRGVSTGDVGIYSLGTVANSFGYTTATSIYTDGIVAGSSVQNSHGYSAGGNGIHSYGTVANSYGYSLKGDGIQSEIVSYSSGRSDGTASSADGIEAFIATSCIAVGGENITHKYLMP